MYASKRRAVLLAVLLAAASLVSCSRRVSRVSDSWNPAAAAAYLDRRESWWMQWSGSARAHGTFCVSCHTALPYVFVRPALSVVLDEPGPTLDERRLIDDVDERVRLWDIIGPYYDGQGSDGKTAQSRGTEAVLNALVLAEDDAQRGKLSNDTRIALNRMWELQQTTDKNSGSWHWLQFDQEPWEAKDSVYYGACLAAIAVGVAPGDYASKPEIQTHLALLREYLNRESASHSTINHVFLLWASMKLPGLISQANQRAIVKEILAKQQTDGGWRLASITWSWHDWTAKSLVNMWLREEGTPLYGKSDGLATGLVTFVLQEAGIARSDAQLQRGLSWLMSHQTAEGSWPTASVNKRRHISLETARFMTDAGTAFAVLALTDGRSTSEPLGHTTPNR